MSRILHVMTLAASAGLVLSISSSALYTLALVPASFFPRFEFLNLVTSSVVDSSLIFGVTSLLFFRFLHPSVFRQLPSAPRFIFIATILSRFLTFIFVVAFGVSDSPIITGIDVLLWPVLLLTLFKASPSASLSNTIFSTCHAELSVTLSGLAPNQQSPSRSAALTVLNQLSNSLHSASQLLPWLTVSRFGFFVWPLILLVSLFSTVRTLSIVASLLSCCILIDISQTKQQLGGRSLTDNLKLIFVPQSPLSSSQSSILPLSNPLNEMSSTVVKPSHPHPQHATSPIHPLPTNLITPTLLTPAASALSMISATSLPITSSTPMSARTAIPSASDSQLSPEAIAQRRRSVVDHEHQNIHISRCRQLAMEEIDRRLAQLSAPAKSAS